MVVDTHTRSLVKALSWRFFSIIITFLVALGITGSPRVAISISLLDMSIKLFIYYLHERLWTNIPWGKRVKTGVS